MENMILIGFMGCGKSTIGKEISKLLKQEFLDTDEWIEKKEKMSISEIFQKYGEEYFRNLEKETLLTLKERKEPFILSTGGGMIIKEENRGLIKELGRVIYLKASEEEIFHRLKKDETRPLLRSKDPREKIHDLLEERKNWYEETAKEIVLVDGKTPGEIVKEILKIDGKRKKMKILVMNGPNINFLGIREKNIYGQENYDTLLEMIGKKAEEEHIEVEVFQSNHEGAIIDRIQDAYFDGTEGIVINPGAYTHYSYAIRDALKSVEIPKVEVHISDITKREEFRKISVTKDVCDAQIYGHGLKGYLLAMDYLVKNEKNS